MIPLATTLLTALLAASTSSAPAHPASAPLPSLPGATVVSVPMHLVPHASARAVPALAAVQSTGSCGTAFLYLSAGDGLVVMDYGFKYLGFSAMGYTTSAAGTNLDTGDPLYDQGSGSLLLRKSFTRHSVEAIDSGRVKVTAQVKAFGAFQDCVSAPLVEYADVV